MGEHVCYMYGGSIINAMTGCIIEEPAILISGSDDVIHGWGNLEDVSAKFNKYAGAYAAAGMQEDLDGLMLIELNKFKVSREMACYVIRRAVEFTATGFIKNLYEQIKIGANPVAWLEAEMKRLPIDLDEQKWGTR